VHLPLLQVLKSSAEAPIKLATSDVTTRHQDSMQLKSSRQEEVAIQPSAAETARKTSEKAAAKISVETALKISEETALKISEKTALKTSEEAGFKTEHICSSKKLAINVSLCDSQPAGDHRGQH
jgi:hypothetical protein